MKLSRNVAALAALLALAPAARANDYITSSRSDWFRYVGPNGVEVRAQISMESGGWRLWDQFGGLGQQWIYADPSSNFFWGWNGSTPQAVADLGGAVGQARTADLGPLNRGQVRIAARNLSLTTPAGTFSDVTHLALTPSAADAGVTGIWFARGVGIVQYEQTSIAGPRRFQLGSASVGGRNLPAAAPAPTPTPTPTPAVAGMRAPPEHAPMETIMWGCNDTYLVLDTYEDAFRGLDQSGVKTQVVVDSNQTAAELRYEMTSRSVPMGNVEVLVAALDSVWMRDYGPIVLKDQATGERRIADLEYYPGRYNDDAFPAAYASYRGWRRVAVNVGYEGGNFGCDGRGQGMASRGVQMFNPNMSTSQILAEFRKLGCDRVEFFEPLIDEGTTHIDMFLKVMTDRDAIVSRYPSTHRQARVVNDAAAKMQALGYNVVRVDSHQAYDEYATYANATLANGVALIPTYGDATKDRAALDAYRALGFRPVSVDSRLIIKYGGATHCTSMQIPR